MTAAPAPPPAPGEPTACDADVWDGPYRMNCGLTLVHGKCRMHGDSTMRRWRAAQPAPEPAPARPEAATLMCECSHHWGVHAESGQTANTAVCHGYTGSATPGPLREPCQCTSFRPWAGPWDSRTGEPVKPLTVTTAATARPEAATPPPRSFEEMLADPNEQFDGRSELLASIAEYAAAPPATAGIHPRRARHPSTSALM